MYIHPSKYDLVRRIIREQDAEVFYIEDDVSVVASNYDGEGYRCGKIGNYPFVVCDDHVYAAIGITVEGNKEACIAENGKDFVHFEGKFSNMKSATGKRIVDAKWVFGDSASKPLTETTMFFYEVFLELR